MKLERLIQEIDPVSVSGGPDCDIRGICCNSRHARAGYLFVAVPGFSTDGWLFARDAVARGAAAVLSERGERIDADVCHIQVRDARAALGAVSAAFNGWPNRSLKLLGITGTNGKTTVSYMLRDVLSRAHYMPGLIGTIKYQVGLRTIPATRTTPDAITIQSLMAQMVSARCRAAIMEVSSHAIAQKRIASLSFDVAAFTNLSRDHLDYHHSMEEYFDAKALLFTGLSADAWALVNSDDPWGRKLLGIENFGAKKLSFGFGNGADIKAEEVKLDSRGSSFVAKTPWGGADVRLGLLGRFNVSNALTAIGCCGVLGVEPGSIAESLSHTTTVRGRLEEVDTERGFQVFVDYAHTDDALASVLGALRETTRGKLIVVFGCGGDRDRSKRPAMGSVASSLSDFAVVTSDNPRRESPSAIIKEIERGLGNARNYCVIEDREEAIHAALMRADDGDIVLVAGKGHESYQEFAHKTVPFDDRVVIRRALNDMAGKDVPVVA